MTLRAINVLLGEETESSKSSHTRSWSPLSAGMLAARFSFGDPETDTEDLRSPVGSWLPASPGLRLPECWQGMLCRNQETAGSHCPFTSSSSCSCLSFSRWTFLGMISPSPSPDRGTPVKGAPLGISTTHRILGVLEILRFPSEVPCYTHP